MTRRRPIRRRLRHLTTDQFDVYDPEVWGQIATPTGTVTVSSGALRINDGAVNDYPYVETRSFYNLTGQSVVFRVTSLPPSPGASVEATLQVRVDSANWAQIVITSDATRYMWATPSRRESGVNTGLTGFEFGTSGVPTHTYVRFSESGGTVTFATSPDGTTWTTRGTTAVAWSPAAVKFRMICGHWGTEAQTGDLVIDSVSTTAPPVTRSSPISRNAGAWTLAFFDDFLGTSIDTTKWSVHDGKTMNNVTCIPANVSVANSEVVLTLASTTSGAMISTQQVDGVGSNVGGYTLPVGGYAEARVKFPGNGTYLYNWPAWWTSGPSWPAAGEHDTAENLNGRLTVNYHGPSNDLSLGAPAGYWGDEWHVYGVHRKSPSGGDVYWDDVLVATYNTNDNGANQTLILNAGYNVSHPVTLTGSAGALRCDWVRAWHPV